ncbi:hypothetical protein [Spiroplasma alleghenense]|uniref:Transcriptional regulator n=1 Tax=Spiroplasma alleghenense TaxID=216931 RepID=A0A345Z4M2_9MOLU|nr:hypothetical protein [Spiroplasma alleghenense]AXK51551.1 transcriptional regulator [Spiroplasma alleghenense]
MEAVITKLIKMKKAEIPNTTEVIASILVDKFMIGVFPNSKELAQEAIVSESYITQFAKKLGYTGYRELLTRLKYEFEHFHGEKEPTHIELDIFQDLQKDVVENINYFQKYKSVFLKLAQEISNSSKIFIYSSYQLRNFTQLFFENLLLLNKNVLKFDHTMQMIESSNLVEENDLVIAFISGQDNSHFIEVLQMAGKKTKNIFCITSHSQENRFKIDRDRKIIMDNIGPNQLDFRLINLNYILVQILAICKTIKP